MIGQRILGLVVLLVGLVSLQVGGVVTFYHRGDGLPDFEYLIRFDWITHFGQVPPHYNATSVAMMACGLGLAVVGAYYLARGTPKTR